MVSLLTCMRKCKTLLFDMKLHSFYPNLKLLQMDVLFIFFTVSSFVLHGAASAADTEGVLVSVMEGDSVTLNIDVAKKQDDKVKWYYNKTRIAQINGDPSKACTDVQCNEGTETFKGRLKLDHQTGSLTITDIRITDEGEYKLQIISSKTDSKKIFSVSVHGVSAAERDKMRKSVKEGQSVTLDPGVTNNPNDVMKWYFNETLITEITGDQSKICTDDQCDERFRDRLKLDHQTGSLTIMNTRITDSGVYQVSKQTSSTSRRRRSISSVKSFEVTVNTVPDSGSDPSAGVRAGIFPAVLLASVAVVVVVVGVLFSQRRRSRKDTEENQPRTSEESPINETKVT